MKIVCTKYRGVFAGNLESKDQNIVVLSEARMCVYWSAETKGVMGLASHGPAKGSKITRSIPKIELTDVTAIMDMTDEAIEKWRAEPWG